MVLKNKPIKYFKKYAFKNKSFFSHFNRKEYDIICTQFHTCIRRSNDNLNNNILYNPFSRVSYRLYQTNKCEQNLNEILQKANDILKETNFYAYIKHEDVDVENNLKLKKKIDNDVEVFKLLNLLNKILMVIKENDDLKLKVWNNPIFIDFLSYIKLKIPLFNFYEMFLFVLCFSKIEFMPHDLLEEIMLVIKEENYLLHFLKEDKTKFFQFLLMLSNIKNLRGKYIKEENNLNKNHINNNHVNEKLSHYSTFINNYTNVILKGLIKKEDEKGLDVEETKNYMNQIIHTNDENIHDIKNYNLGEEENELKTKLSRTYELDCYMLLCTALYNLNVKNGFLLYHISNQIINIIENKNNEMIKEENMYTENIQNINDHKIKQYIETNEITLEKIEIAKKLINIYLSYSSLGCDNYHFYDKMNSFLYNTVEAIPISNCLTLLLSISTLKEQSTFNFPLCILSILEKKFINNFYVLDTRDLLLLIYLFTYLKLYVSHHEAYVCMLDYLVNFHNFDNLSSEEDQVKLLQIYISLAQTSQNGILEKKEKKKKKKICIGENEYNKNVDKNEKESRYEKQYEDKNEDEEKLDYCDDLENNNINKLIVEKLKTNGVMDKLFKNIKIENETNIPEKNEEINEYIDDLYSLLTNEFDNKICKIINIKKNEIYLNYYLNHVYVLLQKIDNPNHEKEIVIHFDTNHVDYVSNPIDIYINMKKQHINNFNRKYILINMYIWKNFTIEERKRFIYDNIIM
ncbi:hypothetical protein C923_01533 [Plasmodium falciparum UGT5.1]|uniref:Uncharacterized protein n=10 Tax=Plasmodium falciparum TaxID=5833 RepID=C6KT21_PLAF7|nr:conserved Plasmodium protein, unknown function [Plasmodium falciparum 3D7]ETW19629.1 hypothetical protein PFFVO_01435 [Plasmodium falciparum Vietnam Oak-Knoll (FVO)]ETW27834.1 hypothetical protein PFFCH_04815 [Plasmodium falciparum FCH/4]ETW50448.1 hypothetical protein PFMALIP_01464 [Plasmodium falciparum MaliPS096_E11]ETW53163.1 hypothetical protein PFUGPA_04791 [Plasmodium falciparum Palo Alto/Uganda]ETW62612.1 hypothetical protein PFMC_01456 [Plasmodium falciparum CAMP/Malaysia]EUR75001|eukprot:XP_966166.1 conserved Plasmodium protein, unknown function [Plasmodium falciparum 3D7]